MSGSEEENSENSEEEEEMPDENTDSRENGGQALQPFDINLPATHQYLQIPRACETVYDYKPEEAKKILTVSIIEMPIVLLPNQLLPFRTDSPVLVGQIKEAARINAFIALKPDFPGNTSNIATLIQISSLHETEDGVSVQAVGRQRCKIFVRRSAINGMPYGDVQVMEEIELPNFAQIFPPIGAGRLRNDKKLRWCAALTAHPQFIIKNELTQTFIENLKRWLLGWYTEEKVKLVLSEGPTSFSYWVAANIPMDMETRMVLLEEPCTDKRLAVEWDAIKKIDTIICKNCNRVLCGTSQVISISSAGSSAHYVNSGGYVHDLLTVSRVSSTRPRGLPSAEYSWFPGYKWTILECEGCFHHIGWRFTSSTLLPPSFYGLTRGSIRPANSKNLPQENNLIIPLIRARALILHDL